MYMHALVCIYVSLKIESKLSLAIAFMRFFWNKVLFFIYFLLLVSKNGVFNLILLQKF